MVKKKLIKQKVKKISKPIEKKKNLIQCRSKLRLKLLIALFFILVIIFTIFTIYSYNQHKTIESEGMGVGLFAGNNILSPSINSKLPLLPIILGLLFVMVVITFLLIIKQKSEESNQNIEYNKVMSDNQKRISKEKPTVSPNDFNLKGRRV